MNLYLHIYENSYGFKTVLLWHGSDEDNAYFHFLTQARKRALDVCVYDAAIDVTRLVAPLYSSIKKIIRSRSRSQNIYVALATSGTYSLPAVILSEDTKCAQRAYYKFARSSAQPTTLLLISNVTDILKDLFLSPQVTKVDRTIAERLKQSEQTYKYGAINAAV